MQAASVRLGRMINLDFENAKAIRLGEVDWSPSPMAGVERKRIEREEAESGRATSVVRYAPGSAFKAHQHPGGEEFLVLDGIFSDETGDFPAISYVRNPIDSGHTPSSAPGCTLFVKLCQMNGPEERTVIHLADSDAPEELLYEDAHERVRFLRVVEGEVLEIENAEILLLSGAATFAGERYEGLCWFRVPRGEPMELAFEDVSTVWLKTGHLPE